MVKSRLDTYHEETEPLKAYYESKGILKKIVGQGPGSYRRQYFGK